MEPRTMNINLTPEQARIVTEKLNSGRFHTAEEVVGEALRSLRENEQPTSSAAKNGTQREAVREMLAFIEKNLVRLEGVSIKALIHEGHRL